MTLDGRNISVPWMVSPYGVALLLMDGGSKKRNSSSEVKLYDGHFCFLNDLLGHTSFKSIYKFINFRLKLNSSIIQYINKLLIILLVSFYGITLAFIMN